MSHMTKEELDADENDWCECEYIMAAALTKGPLYSTEFCEEVQKHAVRYGDDEYGDLQFCCGCPSGPHAICSECL